MSAFVLCKVRHSVSLSPCHAMEPRVGIEQELTEQLMRYSEPLQGVVLSFSNVTLARPYGVIVNEMPYIHCKVLADALVFRPKEGMKLRGVVNKIGASHVGMLFAGVFNGSVAESELPKGYVHNYAQDCWLGADGSSISVNDEVEVQVLRVHVAGGMIAVEATMRFPGAKVVTPVKKSKKKTLDLSAAEPEKKHKKEKLSKKRKHMTFNDDDEEEEQAVEETPVEVETTTEEAPVKAKKSKHKHKDAPVEASPEEEVVVKAKKSKHKDKDAKKKKHKHKKSKHE